MKIAQVVMIPFKFPPNQWGAVEEVMWNYKLCLERLGHICNLVWPNHLYENNPYDIVHIHSGNQGLMIHKHGVPYVFSAHDVHPLIWNRSSEAFINNNDAIKNSLLSIIGGKFIADYYDNKEKIHFLPYGTNTSFFYYKGDRDYYTKRKLLCVAKNTYYSNEKENVIDRKGFFPALQIAKKIGCFLTIAGPNKEWSDKYGFCDIYPGLKIVDEDMGKERLREMYLTNGVFIHLSSIETGQPCLVIMEALATGMPVVATSLDNISIPGVIFVDRNNQEQIINAIETIFSNYDFYSKEGRKFAEQRDWMNVSVDLEKIYKKALNK